MLRFNPIYWIVIQNNGLQRPLKYKEKPGNAGFTTLPGEAERVGFEPNPKPADAA